MTVTQDTLVKDLREEAHVISQYDPEDTATGQLLAKAAARIEQLEATLARQTEALKAVYDFANRSANGIFWRFRDQECAEMARAALQAWETRHDL